MKYFRSCVLPSGAVRGVHAFLCLAKPIWWIGGSNTESRIKELCIDLEAVLEAGKLTTKVAQRQRGRMQFAEAQRFGRAGRRCLRVLGESAEGRKLKLQPKDCFFINLFMKLLQNNVPREVCPLSDSNIVIFTGACYERDDLTEVTKLLTPDSV